MDYFIYTNKELFIGKIKIPEKGYCKVLKYLDTETFNFPFALKVKLIIFRYPKIWAHYSLITMCLNIGTSKTINFPSGTNGKLMVLGVPILKLFRECYDNLGVCGIREGVDQDKGKNISGFFADYLVLCKIAEYDTYAKNETKPLKCQSRLQQTTFIDTFSLFFRENKI